MCCNSTLPDVRPQDRYRRRKARKKKGVESEKAVSMAPFLQMPVVNVASKEKTNKKTR